MVKKKIILYPHGGSGNHGCEALVRILVELFGTENVVLFSSDKKQDETYGVAEICDVRNYVSRINRFSSEHFELMFRHYIRRDNQAYELIPYYHMLKNVHQNDVAVSFGGDNYCYDGMVYQLKIIDKELDRKKISRVLLGCSVEKVTGIEDDLKGFKLISAREKLSYDILKTINPNTYLFPDPAFALPVEECNDVSLHSKNGYVGINLSPMIIENENRDGMVLNNYINLVRYILKNTCMEILLIPHVVWPQSSDMKALEKLKSYFDDNRVILCHDHNCMKQKYIISKCRFMVAARTHASIAAYSTGVPTLVVGYSIKAKGIASDLFGSWEHYVLPAQSMEKENELVDAFKWIMKNENYIKNHYNKVLPEYLKDCKKGLKQIYELVREL